MRPGVSFEAEGPDGNGLLARLPDPKGVQEVVAVRTSQRTLELAPTLQTPLWKGTTKTW
jgi:hypothetical protein